MRYTSKIRFFNHMRPEERGLLAHLDACQKEEDEREAALKAAGVKCREAPRCEKACLVYFYANLAWQDATAELRKAIRTSVPTRERIKAAYRRQVVLEELLVDEPRENPLEWVTPEHERDDYVTTHLLEFIANINKRALERVQSEGFNREIYERRLTELSRLYPGPEMPPWTPQTSALDGKEPSDATRDALLDSFLVVYSTYGEFK